MRVGRGQHDAWKGTRGTRTRAPRLFGHQAHRDLDKGVGRSTRPGPAQVRHVWSRTAILPDPRQGTAVTSLAAAVHHLGHAFGGTVRGARSAVRARAMDERGRGSRPCLAIQKKIWGCTAGRQAFFFLQCPGPHPPRVSVLPAGDPPPSLHPRAGWLPHGGAAVRRGGGDHDGSLPSVRLSGPGHHGVHRDAAGDVIRGTTSSVRVRHVLCPACTTRAHSGACAESRRWPRTSTLPTARARCTRRPERGRPPTPRRGGPVRAGAPLRGGTLHGPVAGALERERPGARRALQCAQTLPSRIRGHPGSWRPSTAVAAQGLRHRAAPAAGPAPRQPMA